MFMPKGHLVAILEQLLKEGLMVARKDFSTAMHFELEHISNQHVIKTLQSLHSRGHVTEEFVSNHYYWRLTTQGTEYLCNYLQLACGAVPATLNQPVTSETVCPRATAGRSGDATGDEGRSTYRRAPGDPDKNDNLGPLPGYFKFRGGFGRGFRP